MDPTRRLLRHYLATIAYRLQKALRDAPANFGDFRVAPTVRTPHELVWHMTGLVGYARTFFTGGEWRPDRLSDLAGESRRFHEVLEDLGYHLNSDAIPSRTFERILQGPLADAMTHVGQIAMLRRIAGSPVAPEHFDQADISPENLGIEQPLPMAPKKGWRPDQPPPAPGKPLE